MNYEAQSLLDKLCDAKVPLAIFVRNGMVRTTKVTSALCADMLSKRSKELMGVYDKECKLEWLVDDLKFAGVK